MPRLTINPLGCRLEQLILQNKSVLWAGPRPDGQLASTHPCLPNFGQITEGHLKDLPQHGPARNDPWQTQPDRSYTYTWSMPAFRDLYPAGLRVERRFTLTDTSLTIIQTLTNSGPKPLPINPGEHLYFPCPAGQRSQITLNRQTVPAAHWTGRGTPVAMAKINPGQPSTNTITLPNIGKLTLTADGYNQFMLWSQPQAEFICIEPVMGLPNSIYQDHHQLAPNQTKIFTLTLAV